MKRKAILVENNVMEFPRYLGSKFMPLFIPFQNRPLVDWYLDELSQVGYDEIIILKSSFNADSEKYVDDGNPWGMDVRFIYSGQSQNIILKMISESDRYAKEDIYFLNDLSLNGRNQSPGLMDSMKIYSQYHLNEELTNPTKISREVSEGIYSGIRSSFNYENCDGEQHIGNYTTLANNVELSGINWIGDHTIIDESVRLKNTIVLPGTYIGRNMSFENCLIYKNCIVDFETGEEIYLDDQLLLSETKKNFGEITSKIKIKNSYLEFQILK